MSSSSISPKMVALVVGLLVAIVAGWFVAITPKRHEASRLAGQINDTRTQIAVAQGSTGQPQGVPIRIADLFQLSRAMPDQTDIPNVLLTLSQIAAETGVTFQSIAPQAPISLGSYQQLGINLVFEGHFYDLSDFLYRLRNLVGVHEGVLDATGRLFSVDSISFTEGDLQFPQVKATLTVSAYVFGDGTGDPIPAGATDGEASPSGSTTTTTSTPAAADDSQPIPAEPQGASAAGA